MASRAPIQKYKKNQGPLTKTSIRALTAGAPKRLVRDKVVVDVDYKGKEHVTKSTEYANDDEMFSDEEDEAKAEAEVDNDDDSSSSSVRGDDGIGDEEEDLFLNETPVNMDETMAVEYLCRTDSMAQAAMNMLVNNMKAGGLEVTMDVLGARTELSADHQKVFDIEWAGQFLEELIWSFMTLGFAVVNLVPSNVKKGEMVPMVIPQTCYYLSFIERFGKRREYRVYPVDQGIGYDEYKRRKRGQRTELDPDRNVSVYVMYPPLPNGDLSSPFAALYDKLVALSFTWENFANADYWASHPYVGVQSTAQNNKPEPNETANIGENQLGIYLNEQKARVEEADREDIRANIEASFKAQQKIVQRRAETGSFGRYGVNPHAMVAPYEHVFLPGIGHQIVEPPRPVHNPLLEQVNHMISAIVASVLGIPPQFLAAEQVMHAANAELNLRLFDKTVKAYQDKIQPILQDLFEKAYKDSHREFRSAAFKEIKDVRKREREGEEVKDAFDRDEDAPKKPSPSQPSTALSGPKDSSKKRPAEDEEKSPASSESLYSNKEPESKKQRGNGEKGEQEKKEDDEEDKGKAKGGKEHAVGESVQRFIKSTGEPAQAGLDRTQLGKKEHIAASKILGRDVTLNEHGRPKRPKFGMSSKPPATLDDKRIKELIKQNISFKIAFKRTPLTDVASLEHAYNVANIIDYNEYAQGLANVIGLDEHRLLTELESREQSEKKMKVQADNMVKYTPTDPTGKPMAPGGGGSKPSAGGGGGGAAKPAASPMSMGKGLTKQGDKSK